MKKTTAVATVLALLVFSQLPASTEANPAPPLPSSSEPALIDIDFAGGKVSSLIATLKASKVTFNLIGETRDLEAELPPFNLRQVEPAVAAQALGNLLTPQGLGINALVGRANGVFVVTRVPKNQGFPIGGFVAFQLESLLGNQSDREVIDAIQAGWRLDPAHRAEDLRLQYHPATTMLLVTGSNEALNIASQIVGNLKRVPPVNRAVPNPAAK